MLSGWRTSRRPPRRLLEGILVALLAGTAFWAFGYASREVPFQGDESNYMFRGRYFLYLFVDRDLARDVWRDSSYSHTQPMLANYIVGATLWSAGYDLEKMKGYSWGKTREQNLIEGRVPDTATLTLIRTPMVWMAVGVVVLLYLLGRILGGPAAGLAAGAVALTSGLSQSVLVRARNDCPLAFFLLLALLIGVLGGRRGRCGALPLVWAVALGVALGLAYAAKLTALLGLLATAAWGCVVAASAWQRAAPASSARFQAAWAAGSGWLVAVAVGLGVFVLANPHLWPNPVEHMGHMFQHRTRQMRSHQRNFSAAAVHDLLQRPRYVLQSSLVEATWGGSRGVPLEALAAGIGCLALLARTGRAYRSGRVLPAEGLVLMTAVTYFAGVSAFLYVRFNLYFLPTFMLVALLSGPGLSTALGSVHDRAVKWRVTRSA